MLFTSILAGEGLTCAGHEDLLRLIWRIVQQIIAFISPSRLLWLKPRRVVQLVP